MIITQLKAGLANQLFQYAVGRRLAHHLGTELKYDVVGTFRLGDFNIQAEKATPEEIQQVLSKHGALGIEKVVPEELYLFMPEMLDYPDDVYLRGYWQCEKYFVDIADIIRQDFTLHDTHTHKGRRQRRGISKKFARQNVRFHFMFDAAIMLRGLSWNCSAAPISLTITSALPN